MMWIWIIIPVVVIAVAIAATPVLLRSFHDDRRVKASAYVAGQAAPADGAVRVAATVRRGVTPTQLDDVFSVQGTGEVSTLLIGALVQRHDAEHEVLLTVPPRLVAERPQAGRELTDYLRTSGCFDSVRVVEVEDTDTTT